MKNPLLPIWVLLNLLVLSESCSKTNPAVSMSQAINLPAIGSSVTEANNEFAFHFLQATLERDSAYNNKLISPLSIYLALSMAYNGASNATSDSIANCLLLSGTDINTLNSVCNALLTQLPLVDPKVQISIANSIWYRQNSYQPYPGFLDIMRQSYSAQVQSLNFSQADAVNTINSWAAQKTQGKIPTIIQTIDPDDMMYLIDAIYFKGGWVNAFNTAETNTDTFYLRSGSAVAVPFMKQQLKANRSSDSLFSYIELPYGDGKNFSMYIAIPNNKGQPVENISALLDESRLQKAISQMDSAEILLELPKWEYAYSINNMKPELSMLGMGIAFGETADFSKIYNPEQLSVYISKAIHKTYIKVDEEGAEATAVTSVGITRATAMYTPLIKANHPFLYTILEKQTRTILFLGIVNDPSAN